MDNLWDTIPTWIALIAAVSAIVGLILQDRLTKFTVSVNLLVGFDNKYDEPAMVKKRKMAARALLSGKNRDAVRDVLNFFEEIGILLQKGAVDPDLVYNQFAYSAISYWMASREYTEELRSADPTWFSAYAYLISRMNKRSSKHDPYLPSEKELREFLVNESKLVIC